LGVTVTRRPSQHGVRQFFSIASEIHFHINITPPKKTTHRNPFYTSRSAALASISNARLLAMIVAWAEWRGRIHYFGAQLQLCGVTVRHRHPAAAADRCATARPRHSSPYFLQNTPQSPMQNQTRHPDLLFVRTHEPSVGSNIIA
jgi:hypothetical protein